MFLHWSRGATTTSQRAYEISSISSQSAAEVLTTQAKFGTYSANVRGAGYVRYYAVPDFDILTSDFAIEFWYWLVETPPSSIPMLAQSESISLASGGGLTFFSVVNSSWYFSQNSDQTLRLVNLGTTKNLGTISTGTWHHVAVSRSSANGLSTYLDGTRITNDTYTTSVTGNRSVWFIGFSRDDPNDSDPGYFIDGFRFTIGSDAGYSGSTITMPTTMPPEVLGETRLRLNFEGSFDDIP